jgi:Protein of unknown function (DUF3237)
MAELQSELVFEMSLDPGEVQDVGTTPHGYRLIAPLQGGTFAGPKLKGDVLSGGADWLLTRPDGVRELDVRLTLRADDGHLISMSYRGINTITPEIVQRLTRGEPVDPSEYYWRTTPRFETGSEKYGWLNRIVAVSVGQRTPTGVHHRVYAIL